MAGAEIYGPVTAGPLSRRLWAPSCGSRRCSARATAEPAAIARKRQSTLARPRRDGRALQGPRIGFPGLASARRALTGGDEIRSSRHPTMITLDLLAQDAGIRHAFFTRQGGVSDGPIRSLNCGFGSGDDRRAWRGTGRSRRDGCGLPADRLVTCHQVHSARGRHRREALAPRGRRRAPTRWSRGSPVSRSASSPPIARRSCCTTRLPRSSAPRMAAGAARLAACRGDPRGDGSARRRARAGSAPGSARASAASSYEVGPEFPQPFLAAGTRRAPLSSHRRRAPVISCSICRGYIEHAAARGRGRDRSSAARHDTVAEEQRFFSYRRACLRGERHYGRGLSAIVLDR